MTGWRRTLEEKALALYDALASLADYVEGEVYARMKAADCEEEEEEAAEGERKLEAARKLLADLAGARRVVKSETKGGRHAR